MVYPQLRAVWCTVSFYKINFNGRRAVMKFAKYYIGSCVKTTQMPIHIGIILHIVAKHNSKIFNGVNITAKLPCRLRLTLVSRSSTVTRRQMINHAVLMDFLARSRNGDINKQFVSNDLSLATNRLA